jgi:DNA-binding transcriptional LysR family regulator
VENNNLTVEAIAEQPLVFFECGALDWLRIHRVFEHLDQPPNIQIQTDNSEMAKKLVIRKAGISFLPGLCEKQEIIDGNLYPIHVPETAGISLQTNLISNHGEHTQFLNKIMDIGKQFIHP